LGRSSRVLWWPRSALEMRSRKAATSAPGLGWYRKISTGDRTILGSISKRGNRYLGVLFVQAAWVVLIKPKSWQRHGLKPWLEAAKKRLITTSSPSRSSTSSPVLLGASWLMAEPSRAARLRPRASTPTVETPYLPRSARGLETRWRIGLPGACEHW